MQVELLSDIAITQEEGEDGQAGTEGSGAPGQGIPASQEASGGKSASLGAGRAHMLLGGGVGGDRHLQRRQGCQAGRCVGHEVAPARALTHGVGKHHVS